MRVNGWVGRVVGMNTPNDTPDLIVTLAEYLESTPYYPEPDIACIHFNENDRQAIRTAIASEKALRAKCVRVLKRIEWSSTRIQHWGQNDFSPPLACCPECHGLKPLANSDREPGDDHAPDCALSALLARLEAK